MTEEDDQKIVIGLDLLLELLKSLRDRIFPRAVAAQKEDAIRTESHLLHQDVARVGSPFGELLFQLLGSGDSLDDERAGVGPCKDRKQERDQTQVKAVFHASPFLFLHTHSPLRSAVNIMKRMGTSQSSFCSTNEEGLST